MELPNLISKISGNSPDDREYFFALEINPHSVKSAIWTVANNKPQVVSVSHPTMWEGKEVEDLVNAVDTSLAASIQNFTGDKEKEPSQVVFGLPGSWVDSEKIKSEYHPYLKEISKKLDIKPIGFVVTPEAIVHYIRTQEGVPPSLTLIGIDDFNIDVTLIKLGQVVGTQTVARSVSIGEDLDEGLSRFRVVDMLPSRILLYDADTNLEEIKQQLLAIPWQDKHAFLHFPKIESLASDFSIRAVSISGGTEFMQSQTTKSAELDTDLKPKANYRTEILSPPEVSESTAEEFDEEIAEVIEESDNPEDFGFSKSDNPPLDQAVSKDPSSDKTTPIPQSKFHFTFPKLKIPSINLKLPFHLRPRPEGQSLNLSRKKPILFIVILVLAAIGFGFAYWNLPKATLTISVEPKLLDKQISITTSTQIDEPNPENNLIPSQIIETQITDSKSIQTTGEKTVGERAGGDVTVYNATPQTRTLPAGTLFTSPSGLRFTLNSPVTIASKSGSAISSDPGTAIAKITASSIGSESNLASNTEFRIDTFSTADLAAKNESPLSGGSSRQVKAVSEEDMNSLESSLIEELKAKTTEELQAKMDESDQLVESSIKTQVISRSFSDKLGVEATNLELSLTVEASGLVFSRSDLNSVVESELSASIPDGYSFSRDQLNPNFKVARDDGDQVTFDVTFSANLLPRISIEEIRSNLSGKSVSAIESSLRGLPGFVSAHAEIFPRFMPHLPLQPQKIDVIIKSK